MAFRERGGRVEHDQAQLRLSQPNKIAEGHGTRQLHRRHATPYLEHSALHLLHRAEQCASEIFVEEMGSDDLTPRQYAVLVTVAENEGLSQTQLVERTGIDRSTIANITRRLLKKGAAAAAAYARRCARAYSVKLTDKGWEAIKAANPAIRRIDERLLAALPGAQRDSFIEFLSTIVKVLDDERRRASSSKGLGRLKLPSDYSTARKARPAR